MAVRIETPFPSVHTVAKIVGVSPERVREIERMLEARPKTSRPGRVSNRQSGNGRRSTRSRSDRRS